MLEISIPDLEYFNDQTDEFGVIKGQTILLEHSLLSLAKWESRHHKPFLSDSKSNPHTQEEMIDYIRCMTITKNVNPVIYYAIDNDLYSVIQEYIDDPMTATWFSDDNKSSGQSVITNEVIYYYMTALNIPFECEKWHLNRLMTLIGVCARKSSPPKKMTKEEVYSKYQELNEQRKRKLHTSG